MTYVDKPWWAQVRDRAPYWRARVERLQGPRRGEPPRCVIKMGAGAELGGITNVDALYGDLVRALGRLQWQHPDGERLAQVAELWIASATVEEIGAALARPVSERQVRRLLNAAFRWTCDPEGGGFTSAMPSADGQRCC